MSVGVARYISAAPFCAEVIGRGVKGVRSTMRRGEAAKGATGARGVPSSPRGVAKPLRGDEAALLANVVANADERSPARSSLWMRWRQNSESRACVNAGSRADMVRCAGDASGEKLGGSRGRRRCKQTRRSSGRRRRKPDRNNRVFETGADVPMCIEPPPRTQRRGPRGSARSGQLARGPDWLGNRAITGLTPSTLSRASHVLRKRLAVHRAEAGRRGRGGRQLRSVGVDLLVHRRRQSQRVEGAARAAAAAAAAGWAAADGVL